MSFRNEIKIKTNSKMEYRFYKWLTDNEGKEIFEKRRVTSIYFDNDDFGTYEDSIEGTVPRKKIRLRTYNNFFFLKKDKIFLENKFSSIEGRFKTIKKINDYKKIISNGLIESQYGIIKPKIKVDYSRKYFLCKNIRFTVDKYINYSRIDSFNNSKISKKSDDVIIELKTKSNFDVEEFFKKNQFEKTRYSKYCNAVEQVFY
jgi:SPX domain protein involved in polyphosphate accumulation